MAVAIKGTGRPRIGVTAPRRSLPFAWWATRAALALAGGEAVLLRPGDPIPHDLRGLVVGGGADIGRALYDPTFAEVDPPDPDRDAFEIEALQHCLWREMPVLGICRGSQLLNVVLGGDLDPDVRARRLVNSNRSTILPTRAVRLEAGSRLSRLLRRHHTRVNAIHRQAVDATGDGLAIVAYDADDIPQAVEHEDATFVLGVQWHPEYLAWQPLQRRIFTGLVRSARGEEPLAP
ncbi:MAG: gamma-glutamyl-gamma-aminobutyrate hydrolase family protein [Pseudomonadales bacterium]|jgi:putative glutamine amidotransferase|nr:gamma-glutamyl-gamma-aminobutyrate hydrolase family protein [Pseudomonadales bacterium]